VKIDPMPQIGDILRTLVGDSRHIVLVNEHDRGVTFVGGGQFLHIDDGAVGDASGPLQPGAALAFQVVQSLRLAPKKRVRAQQGRAPGRNQPIKSK